MTSHKQDQYVALLEDFVTEDDQPTIEARCESLHHDTSEGDVFADCSAYDSDWGEEISLMRRMVRSVEMADTVSH